MNISKKLIYKYPWLPSLKSFLINIKRMSNIEFMEYILSHEMNDLIFEQIYNIFATAIKGRNKYYYLNEINPLCYLLMKKILHFLDNKEISNKISEFYSKVHYEILLNENEYNLFQIYKNISIVSTFPPNPIIYRYDFHLNLDKKLIILFKIHYIDYLNLSSRLSDDHRRLVNQKLSNGYIYINKKNLVRLIQEKIRINVLKFETFDKGDILFFKQKFKGLYLKILKIWEEHRPKYEEITFDKNTLKSINATYFPPCLKKILSRAQDGENLQHHERLFILWFLSYFNYPKNEIIKIFSTLPDFDREKTEYQVKYALEKKYIPYNCSKMRSFNLCFPDIICKGGYYSKIANKQKMLVNPNMYTKICQYRAQKRKQKKNIN